MGVSGTELAANLHNAGGGVLFHIGILTLRRGQIRVKILQLLCCDKAYFPAQRQGQLREADVEPIVGIADCPDNCLNNELQVIQIPV